MKPLLLSAALLLSSCTTVEYVPVGKAELNTYTKPDPAAAMMLKCDSLGFLRGSDGHRLCVMRGVDRLGVEAKGPNPVWTPIPLLTYPYPPLAPSSRGVHILP